MGIFSNIMRKKPMIKIDKKARSYLQSLDDRMQRIESALQAPSVKKARIKARVRHLNKEHPEQYYLGRKRGKYGY